MNKDQEIINKYNKKRNKEITEEHLYNIEKLRENFKQKVVNEYKEKIISYLYDENNHKDENNKHIYEIENFALTLIVLIKNGEFD